MSSNPRLSFLAAFGLEIGNKAFDGLISALAKADPKTASDADIKVIVAEVSKAAAAKVDAINELHGKGGLKEQLVQLETDRANAMTALSILKTKHDGAADDAKADIEHRAQVVNHQIETTDTHLEQTRASMKAGEDWLAQATQALTEAADWLANARQAQADAIRDQKVAARELELAKRQEQRQKEVAGITGAANHLGVALGAMKDSAANDRRAAAIAKETSAAIGAASMSGMDEVRKVLGTAGTQKAADPFARLQEQKAA